MNIYAEFNKNKIRLTIGEEELEIIIKPDFYVKAKGTESYNMFLDAATNKKIKDFLNRYRNKLGFYKTLGYLFLRNRALVMLDNDVQALMTIRLIHAYATLSFDARVVYIIRKPVDFTNHNLGAFEDLKGSYLNNGRMNEEMVISKLPG